MTDAAQPTVHSARHETLVAAPAEAVYRIIASAEQWPVILAPTIHVERLAADGQTELLQLWAFANDEIRSWTSARTLDPVALRITFQQQQPKAPVAAMSGAWTLEPRDDGTRVVLDHDFSAVDDAPDAVRWIGQATDRNSVAELAAIASVAETHLEHAARTVSFEDTLRINGDISDVYEFLLRAQDWPQRIPHVSRLELTENQPGVQVMTMDTRTPDGSTHTTKSVRVCLDGHRIVYKQVETPALMAAHTGEWRLAAEGDHVVATSRHTVVLRTEAVPAVLGAHATLGDARRFVQSALSANSMATLRHAATYAESVRRSAVR